ncbi:MAG: response regulator transcription factor [Blautia sp.]|nr:response regulator transcription factor [Blautia sp.]
MNTIHIALVDDDRPDLEWLKEEISILSEEKNASVRLHPYLSAEEFLRVFRPGMFQLVFLDIYMKGMTGIELARAIRAEDPALLLVFITSSREHAFDTFPLHPFDYLVKPCGREDIARVLKEAGRILHLSEPVVDIRCAYNSLSVPLSKIVSVLSSGHSLEVHTTDRQVIRSIMTFSELQKMLMDDPRFLTCNRGILVNMDHVLSLNGDAFLMKAGPSCALRVRDRAQLIARFTQYQISRMKRGMSR